MKNTNLKGALPTIKDALVKACIYFMAMPVVLGILASFLNMMMADPLSYPDYSLTVLGFVDHAFNSGTYFPFALTALAAGFAVQVFKIKKLPSASRHIAFFILIYLDFILIFMPMSSYSVNQNTTMLLSAAFVLIYLLVFGMAMGTKAIAKSINNKKSDYEKQF
jgi:hypothetical protein